MTLGETKTIRDTKLYRLARSNKHWQRKSAKRRWSR